MIQGELFDPSRNCSREAWEKVDIETWRQRVIDIYKSSHSGLIADEVAVMLDCDVLTIRPRVTELKSAGLLIPTGVRRKSYRGNTCAVLIWFEYT